jgi:small subunit ribosomal protein S6
VAAYELIYIISPEVSEEELPQVIEKMSQSVSKAGGNVVELTKWGRKRMAYPIRRFAEGNYVFNRIELEPVKVKEIEANLRLSDEVLRHLMIKVRA